MNGGYLEMTFNNKLDFDPIQDGLISIAQNMLFDSSKPNSSSYYVENDIT